MPDTKTSHKSTTAQNSATLQLPPKPGSDPAAAMTTLLDLHGPKLHGLAMRLCGHKADAEDMVQEVFLQAFRKWHTFKGKSDPGTWLYAIASHSCKDRMRRKGGVDRRMPVMSQLMPWSESTVMEIATAQPGAEDKVERKEAIAKVQSAITQLPEHMRIPLVLKEILGLSVEDTAAALGLAANTVKTRLHRARLALRKEMIEGARSVTAPDPIYEKQVCLDLLKTKMEAMDRSGKNDSNGFVIPRAEMCARCRAVFHELDLVHDACAEMSASTGDLPNPLRQAILKAINDHDRQGKKIKPNRRRGRRPVKSSSTKRSKASRKR